MSAVVRGLADIERLVEFARRVPVFPCSPQKRPLVATGFHAATQDEAQIRAWWAQWPDALVGVPTGERTGLVVIDLDPDKATHATHSWIAEHTELLTSTRSHTTGRDGRHYLFRSTDRYQTGTDLVLDGSQRRGLDLRAAGGYVIWWPLHGGRVVNELAAPLPAGLIDERRFVQHSEPLPASSAHDWAADRARVVWALESTPCEGYERWIQVGMAIHHASGGSADGFAVWLDWSERGPTFESVDDCRFHWHSFGRSTGRVVTLGTLFHIARECGWQSVTMADELPPIDAYDAGEAEREALPQPPVQPAAKITFRHLSEIVAERREPEWLLHKILEANVLAVLAGPRGSFKSFVALDWAMRVATNGECVVVLSGEGAGLDRRADAWMRVHGQGRELADLPFYALERPVNLRPGAELQAVSEAIAQIEPPPRLIEIDTLSKYSAGIDENDNGEMSEFLAGLALHLRQRFQSTVLLVAHSGHGDSKRPRGASVLMANPDAEYIVERAAAPSMMVSVSRERFKDSPALDPLGFEATPVDLGRFDAYGEAVTSLVLQPCGPPPRALKQPGGKVQRQLLTGLRNLQRDSKTGRMVWTEIELREISRGAGAQKQAARSAVEALIHARFLVPTVGGYALPPEELA